MENFAQLFNFTNRSTRQTNKRQYLKYVLTLWKVTLFVFFCITNKCYKCNKKSDARFFATTGAFAA